MCRLLVSVFIVACFTDSASAQRFRRVRRYNAATAARSNADPTPIGPRFYPFMMAPPFAPPSARVVPPFLRQFGVFAAARPVVRDPVELNRDRRDSPKREALGANPPPSAAPPQSLGPELRPPEQSAPEDRISPAEMIPPPEGELPAPMQQGSVSRPQRGREF